jgi:hypothetical protein
MGRTDFLTPHEVIDVLRALWPDAGARCVDLDPCSSPRSIVPARVVVLLPEAAALLDGRALDAAVFVGDGLALDWSPAARIFCNPPYSRAENDAWGAKIAAEGAAARARGGELVALVQSAPGSAYWARYWQADALLWPRTRVRFLDAVTGERLARPSFDVALAYWGGRVEAFAAAGATLGPTAAPVRT